MMQKVAKAFKVVWAMALILICLLGLCVCVLGRIIRNERKPYVSYSQLMYIADECDEYKEKFGMWPQSIARLASLQAQAQGWTNDAWGNEIIFVPYSGSVRYGKVISYGRDGQPGGTGLNRDIEIRFPTEANSAWNMQQTNGFKDLF